MSAMLEVAGVDMQFGGLKALSGIDFSIDEGELVALIGPNGAGKTTFFNVLTGVYQPTQGSIRLRGESLLGKKPHQIATLGMTRTFQNIRLFKELSVFDNVRIGAHERVNYGLASAILGNEKESETEQRISELATGLLETLGLTKRRDELASRLPYGEQRRLEIARAMATGARMLLLDEPAAGMNERETETLMHDLIYIRHQFKLTLLLIEHDMRLVMGLSERIIVLDHGVIIGQGKPAEVRENPAVLAAYLGSSGKPANGTEDAAVARKPEVAPLLAVKNLEVKFGPIQALKGVSLEVYPGELVTLIGSNGAGKSTTLRAISGMCRPSAGTIQFADSPAVGLTPNELVSSGIAHAPEGRRIFAELTVRENLELGAYLRKDEAQVKRDLDHQFELFPRLRDRLWQRAGTLSGGEQQMLAIARALMAAPRLLLLDEPSLGLAPQLVEQIFDIIRMINKAGVAVLLVEQNANQALATASRGYVLETGKIVLSGSAKELLANPAVRSAYLGG